MTILSLSKVNSYVNEHINQFHEQRINKLQKLSLSDVIKKNPYLFKAKNITLASELIQGVLSAFLSSSEEGMFGDFFEGLAIYVAMETTGGHKSGTTGIDLEFQKNGIHYFVSIKSGANWGNSSQLKKLEDNFKTALKVYRQSRSQLTQADVLLGICYGKTRTSRLNGYLKLVGQNFWTFISDDPTLYKEIIEPIGFRAKEHNDVFENAKANLTNKLTKEFLSQYCYQDGSINWDMLIEKVSGNYDLDKHGL